MTSVTFLTAVGDKAMLLHTPWTSSRYAFTPGVLVLVMLLGCVRRGAGALRAALCAVLLGCAMVRGVMQYPRLRALEAVVAAVERPGARVGGESAAAAPASGRRRGRCRFPPPSPVAGAVAP